MHWAPAIVGGGGTGPMPTTSCRACVSGSTPPLLCTGATVSFNHLGMVPCVPVMFPMFMPHGWARGWVCEGTKLSP